MAGESANQLIDQLLKGGVPSLLEIPEVRAQCETTARDLGCVPPTHKIVVALLAQFAGYSQGLASEWARTALVRTAERWPALRALLARLLAIEAACRDRDQLRRYLLAELRGESNSVPLPAADHSSSVEMLKFLWDRNAFASLETSLQEELGELAGELQRRFANIYDPVLSDKAASREAARFGAENGRVIDRLIYTAEWDELLGRDDDLDFLQGFLGCADATSGWSRFRWQLVVGDAGEGKSRLALHFRDLAASHAWHAGFLDQAELERIDAHRWRPRVRTLLIIDYAAEVGQRVAELIASCAENATQFDFAVRILLLERSADGDWYRRLTPDDSNGPMVQRTRYAEPRRLKPLSLKHVAHLMAVRLARADGDFSTAPDFSMALDIGHRLLAIDGRVVIDDKGERIMAPRPLYAAALAEFIASESGSPEVAVAAATRERVLGGLLQRERQHYWAEPEWDAPPERRRTFARHLNLLALATMVRGISLPLSPKKAIALPDLFPSLAEGSFDLDLGQYHRMSRQDQRRLLAPLEPDLLGEYFVVSRLIGLSDTGEHLAVIEAGFEIGDNGFIEFILRASLDFPEQAEQLGFFACGPHASDHSLTVCCIAQANLALLLPASSERDHAGALVKQVRSLAKGRLDKTRALFLAHGTLNLIANYLRAGRLAEAKVQMEWLKAFYAKHRQSGIMNYGMFAAALLLSDELNDPASRESLELLKWIKTSADKSRTPALLGQAMRSANTVVRKLVALRNVKLAEREAKWMVTRADRLNNAEAMEDIVQAVLWVFKLHLKLQDEAGAIRLYSWLTRLRTSFGGKYVVMAAGLAGYDVIWCHLMAGREDEADAEFAWIREEAERTGAPEMWSMATGVAFNIFVIRAPAAFPDGRRIEIDWLRETAARLNDSETWLLAARASLWAMILYQVGGDERAAMADRLWIKYAAQNHPDNRELTELDNAIGRADIFGWSTRRAKQVIGTEPAQLHNVRAVADEEPLEPVGLSWAAIKQHPLEPLIAELFRNSFNTSLID